MTHFYLVGEGGGVHSLGRQHMGRQEGRKPLVSIAVQQSQAPTCEKGKWRENRCYVRSIKCSRLHFLESLWEVNERFTVGKWYDHITLYNDDSGCFEDKLKCTLAGGEMMECCRHGQYLSLLRQEMGIGEEADLKDNWRNWRWLPGYWPSPWLLSVPFTETRPDDELQMGLQLYSILRMVNLKNLSTST